MGVIFFSLVFVILGNQQNIPRVFQERLMLYRERGAGVYGSVEYWVAIGLSPVSVSCSFAFSFSFYLSLFPPFIEA